MQKRVSVVMPVYNEERFIGKCIESLLQQTYPQRRYGVVLCGRRINGWDT